MKRILLLALSVVVTGACSNKQDANEKNFGQAVSRYLETNGELCVARGRWKDASQPNESGFSFMSITKEMETLEKLGLVEPFGDGQANVGKNKAKQYKLTDTGQKFYRAKALDGGTDVSGLCYGKQSLDKIIKWEGPIKLGDYQAASVIYTYKIDDLADWAKTPEFQSVFRGVANKIDGAGKENEKIGVTLTNLGWEAK